MAIFTGGKSKAINSPRHLTLRHARRKTTLSRIARGLVSADEDDQPVLRPGEEKLNSFWAPGLEAGPRHVVLATQTIKAPGNPDLVLTSEQDFYVDAPQFSLPEGSVYSVFPPPGYPEDANILPHVVLSDPHLPWERRGSPEDDCRGDGRNRVPWLVLFTFAQDELRLAPDSLGGTAVKQTPTLAVTMTVGDMWNLGASARVATPITEELGPERIRDAKGDFILIKPDLFKSMFSTFGDDNRRAVASTPETTKYKYLAHVRNINTTGMAEAGKEDVGIFSVVVGSRSGPLGNTSPVLVSVHLVSIEGVEEMTGWPDDKKFVALCSLHSWNYTVNPPGTRNVHDAFVNLGETLNLLRAPDSIIEPLLQAPDKLTRRLARRLQDGYSLVKYRVQTGEQTVALYRGPFTPTAVAPLGAGSRLDREVGRKCSNSGQDLQILDREVGIMDVSYSAAWQIGRILALGDQGFAAALVRHRATIQHGAMKESKIHLVRGTGGPSSFRTRTDILADIRDTVGHLDNIHLGDGRSGFAPGPARTRWHRPRLAGQKQYPSLGFNAPNIKSRYHLHATAVARKLALAKDGTVYNETNDPVSTDWMHILAWVMDRMFLSGVPAHYLISDPSHLPHESLRFFCIDPNWVDALIDGALSLGNHMGEDRDRAAIKEAINAYIHHTPADQTHAPQIPTYGFYLRSDLVTMFPDLKVTTMPEPPKGVMPDQAPLLRHEIVADGVMIGLLDRLPDAAEGSDFGGLCFTQPPHQQRFAVGYSLAQDRIGIDIRRQYTVAAGPQDGRNWFVWNTDPSSPTDDLRVIRLPFYAEEQTRVLMDRMDKRYFDDDTPNSALLAMQLNDAFYRLVISATDHKTASLFARIRDQTHAPRGLGLMGPSYVRKSSVDEKEDQDSEGEGEGEGEGGAAAEPALDACSPARYQRHESYRPLPHVLSANLGPHVRAIPAYEPSHPDMRPPTNINPPGRGAMPHMQATAAIPRAGAGTDPAGPPVFDCRVYTAGYSAVQTSADPLPQDIVFSVQVSNTAVSDYQLIEFQLVVPLGQADDANSHRLFPLYDGPGPRMLSNLRFNVLAMLGVEPTVANGTTVANIG
ncbi:hypothetical protein BT67DRAFT_417956 [Trichocladium antarcticum]|uniref:Uncharacterized protein n=1 Tax=Trichocladium antarcticum TaxID=1450529 RepID=A0AAN6ZF38_9PEZI|nr:hypothetical protein BT67DRAFT_417956 [Trichocladium antarcticum]